MFIKSSQLCPVKNIIERNLTSIDRRVSIILAIQVGENRPIQIRTISTGKPEAPCQAVVTNPKGQKINLLLTQTTEGYQTVFTPLEPGPYKVNVVFSGKEVPKSPFYVNVEQPVEVGSVQVSGLEKRKLSVCWSGL